MVICRSIVFVCKTIMNILSLFFKWIFWIWLKLFTVVGKRLYISSIMQKSRTDIAFPISICILSKNISSCITVYFFLCFFYGGGGRGVTIYIFFKYWNWWTLNRVRFFFYHATHFSLDLLQLSMPGLFILINQLTKYTTKSYTMHTRYEWISDDNSIIMIFQNEKNTRVVQKL